MHTLYQALIEAGAVAVTLLCVWAYFGWRLRRRRRGWQRERQEKVDRFIPAEWTDPGQSLRCGRFARAIADAEQRGRAEERRAVLDYIGRFPHGGMKNWDTIARGMHYPKTEEESDERPG